MSKDKKPPGPPVPPTANKRRTTRDVAERVKTAKFRKTSSTLWLQRQLNDPYVREAERLGYRSRAAFKLKDMDDRLKLLKPGMTVIDLGAAPGGWCQVAAERGAGKIIALDLLPIDPIAGVTFFQMDFMDDDAPEVLINAMGSGADLVLSDMAPNTTGHKQTDHIRILALAEMAYDFAAQVLRPNGTFIAKVLLGGTQHELLNRLKKDFKTVRHMKPPSSRPDSSEQYVVAQGFRGAQSE